MNFSKTKVVPFFVSFYICNGFQDNVKMCPILLEHPVLLTVAFLICSPSKILHLLLLFVFCVIVYFALFSAYICLLNQVPKRTLFYRGGILHIFFQK